MYFSTYLMFGNGGKIFQCKIEHAYHLIGGSSRMPLYTTIVNHFNYSPNASKFTLQCTAKYMFRRMKLTLEDCRVVRELLSRTYELANRVHHAEGSIMQLQI